MQVEDLHGAGEALVDDRLEPAVRIAQGALVLVEEHQLGRRDVGGELADQLIELLGGPRGDGEDAQRPLDPAVRLDAGAQPLLDQVLAAGDCAGSTSLQEGVVQGFREERRALEVALVHEPHHFVVAGIAERLDVGAVEPGRLHEEVVQHPARVLAQALEVRGRGGVQRFVDRVAVADHVRHKLGAEPLEQGRPGRRRLALDHVPGQRLLQLAQLRLRILQVQGELGDERLELLVALDRPGLAGERQAEPVAALPGLDVAHVEHDVHVEQRPGERHSGDGGRLSPQGADPGVAAVGDVIVEADFEALDVGSYLDRHVRRPLEGDAVLRDVVHGAFVVGEVDAEVDVGAQRGEVLGPVALGAEEDLSSLRAFHASRVAGCENRW